MAIDGTERRRQRPTNAAQQQGEYSGKKKPIRTRTSCWSTNTPPQSSIWGRLWPGKSTTRKRPMKERLPIRATPRSTRTRAFRAMSLRRPHAAKKPKGQELSVADRFLNHLISSARVVVENVIAGVKRCRIVQDVLRLTKAGMSDLVMEIACEALQSPRELSSPVPHMRCAEFGQLWLNPIMSILPQ